MKKAASPLQHVAIILDGNRTWAKQQGLSPMEGHSAGAKNIQEIVTAAIAENIAYLTLYMLSTENLKNRSPKELKHLFSLFAKIEEYLDLFAKHNIRFQTIGDTQQLPAPVRKAIKKAKQQTAKNTKLILTFAINYGGRDEIIRAVKKLVKNEGGTKDISEKTFEKHLDTADMPDVDLVIRTGGYQRLSNFLLWQASYAELYFTPLFFPAFSQQDFQAATQWFDEQKRKKGA